MQLTDYSPDSVAKFQDYLQSKYHNIEELNKSFNSDFPSFKDIYPPAKNINTDKLTNFFQHIDYASSGELAIYGWAAGKDGSPVKVKVFIDGTDAGYAEYGLNRLMFINRCLRSGGHPLAIVIIWISRNFLMGFILSILCMMTTVNIL